MSQPFLAIDDLRPRALTAAVIGGAALLFMAVALINGSPFVFWDTTLYFALGKLVTTSDPASVIVALQNDPSLVESAVGPEQRELLLNRAASHLGLRSVAYSLFLDRVAGGVSMWAAALAQCLLVSVSLWAALRIIWGVSVKRWKFLALAAALAVTTPVSIAGPLLMPDIYAAPMILLVAALFAAHERIDRRGLVLLAAGLVVCMTVHMSHLVIAALTGVGAALVLLLHAKRPAALARPAATLAGALAAALAVNAALSAIAESRLGRELHRPPHLAARIIDDGPGRAYLAEDCEESSHIYCVWAERILGAPIIGGDSMIWKRDPAQGAIYLIEDLSVGEALRRDETPFILDVIANRPFEQIAASTGNVFRLLRSFRPDGSGWWETGSVITFSYGEYADAARQLGANELLSHLPNREACMETPRKKCGAAPIRVLKPLHYLTVGLAALAVLAVAVGFVVRNGARPSAMDRAEMFVVLICGGILSNAVVCGVLGGVFDRYQSRVIWMLPAVAAALLLFSLEKFKFRSWKGGAASSGRREAADTTARPIEQ